MRKKKKQNDACVRFVVVAAGFVCLFVFLFNGFSCFFFFDASSATLILLVANLVQATGR